LPNAAYDVVALAASLGGLKVISQILSALPPDFPAAITVVQHLHPLYPSLMADILSRRTPLTVKQASAGDQLRSGTVYIAPPNHHLLVNPDGILFLSQSERVNFVRPCADLLFESVATTFKERAIAVVLTGRGCDGARGVQAIRKMGGMVLAQDEATCASFSMPSFAIDTGSVDLILPLNQIAFALETLVMSAEASIPP
jgi:two-component system chemotaxis response regulator CheB